MNKLLASKNRLSQALENLEQNIDKLINVKNSSSNYDDYNLELVQDNKKLKGELEKFKQNNQEIAMELADTIKQLDLYISQKNANN